MMYFMFALHQYEGTIFMYYDKPSKSIPGQVNLLSQIGGLNYWFIHPYKKLSQIGGLIS